jgi:hypothetical protein
VVPVPIPDPGFELVQSSTLAIDELCPLGVGTLAESPHDRSQGVVGSLQVQRTGDGRIGTALFAETKGVLVAAPSARAARVFAIALGVAVLVPRTGIAASRQDAPCSGENRRDHRDWRNRSFGQCRTAGPNHWPLTLLHELKGIARERPSGCWNRVDSNPSYRITDVSATTRRERKGRCIPREALVSNRRSTDVRPCKLVTHVTSAAAPDLVRSGGGISGG